MTKLIDYISDNALEDNAFSDPVESVHLSDDWEILADLLEQQSSVQDHHRLAFDLLKEFGNLPAIISQETENLMRVPGMKPEVARHILTVRRAAAMIAEKRIRLKPALNNWQAIENYCTTMIGYEGSQNVMAIYLDADFRPIRSEKVAKGTVNDVAAYPREIIKRMLQLDAYSVIFAKNIPSGRLEANPCEINVANKLKEICEAIDIHLTDAVLVGKCGVRSILRS